MTKKIMVSVEEATQAAFTDSEYVKPNSITENHIYSVQQRYLTPIMGEELCQSVYNGLYTDLYDDYILPLVGELVRIEVDLEAYPTRKSQRQRCRTMLEGLSNHLNSYKDRYPEYSAGENVMNRCTMSGGLVL